MQDVNCVLEFYRVNAAKRISAVVGHDLKDTCASEPLERLGITVPAARLRDIDRETHASAHLFGKTLQVA
jgi:hypothetical protein